MYKKNIILVIGLLLVLTLFYGCVQEVEPISLGDEPVVAYMKLEGKAGGKLFYSLNVSSFDGISQKIEIKCLGLAAAAKGNVFLYETREKENKGLYLLNRSGESQLVAEDIAFFELCENGCVVLYAIAHQIETVILKEFTPKGDIVREEAFEGIFAWNMNSKGDILVFTMKKDSKNEEPEFGYQDITMYANGQMIDMGVKGALSQYDQSVSNDGTFLYLSDVVKDQSDTYVGTLCRKEMDADSEVVVETSTLNFAINNDGGLVASIVHDQDGNDVLFYQYVGEEPVYVQDVVQFHMSRDSNTLYYTVGDRVGWKLALYGVVQGKAPVKVSENASWIIDSTADGKTVAYIADFDSEELQADLYVAREGEQIEFVVSDIGANEVLREIATAEIKLYYDGTAIAYRTDVDEKYDNLCCLYLKEKGKDIVKIDDQVSFDFDFLK